MSSQRQDSTEEATYATALRCLERILESNRRAEILRRIGHQVTDAQMLIELRALMRGHRFTPAPGEPPIASWVRPLERRTIEDGFHVLNDWDGQAERLNPDIIPVDVVQFLIDRGPLHDAAQTAAIACDYYFLYILALLAMRIWDGDPDRNLDRLDALVSSLQGTGGSGHRFVDNASTLILLATSHFEPDESAFVRLRTRLETLREGHRTIIGLSLAPILSSHLRFGFQATYGRDLVAMRKDNAPDYPWLLFALGELMRSYAAQIERPSSPTSGDSDRSRIAEALINGLAPDPKAFLGRAPLSLADRKSQVDEFQRLARRHRDLLLADIDAHLPTEEHYSPIAFFFNFPHNLLKAIVVDSAARGEPSLVSLNDLLTAAAETESLAASRVQLVETLMNYAKASPDRIRGRLTPVIVYDFRRGRRAFADARKILASLDETRSG